MAETEIRKFTEDCAGFPL